MSNTTTQLTDEELMAKLKASHIEQHHKDALKPLIPNMDAKARKELIALIEESYEVDKHTKEIKAEYQKEMHALNNEYDKKMHNVVKEKAKKAREELESMEKVEAEKGLEELEKQLKKIK